MKVAIFGGGAGIGLEIAKICTGNGNQVITFDARFNREALEGETLVEAVFPVSPEPWGEVRHKHVRALEGVSRVFITLGKPSGRLFSKSAVNFEYNIMEMNFHAVTSALRLARGFASEKCSYVLTSSVSASQADPGGSIYGAAKAAIEQLTRQLAREWQPARVNCIAPGPTATQQFLDNVPVSNMLHEMSRSPHNRLLLPQEVGDAAVALSNLTGVSGVVLPVDLAGLSSSRKK